MMGVSQLVKDMGIINIKRKRHKPESDAWDKLSGSLKSYKSYRKKGIGGNIKGAKEITHGREKRKVRPNHLKTHADTKDRQKGNVSQCKMLLLLFKSQFDQDQCSIKEPAQEATNF